VKDTRCVLQEDAIKALIRWYCREAGVRNLSKHIEKVYRKVAYKIAKGLTTSLTVTQDNLEEYVGKPKFTSDRMYDRTPIGVVMGLAWSSMGGATMYVEAAVTEHRVRNVKRKDGDDEEPRGGLFCTGQMGDVMKESTQIAYTVAKTQVLRIEPKNRFFQTERLHMHVPEGATPKDGPSAGITMVCSLVSLALNKPVRDNIAMTGELTITGKVLPIGGVKEKVIAARRSRVFELIFPQANKKDYDELAPYIKEGVKIHYVQDIKEVLDIAFGPEPETPIVSTAED